MKVVVVGAGDVGTHITKHLSETSYKVVLVDKSRAKIEMAEESFDAMTLVGDILHAQTLEQVDCDTVDLFLAATDSDATNIVAAARAAKLGARVTISRVDDPAYYSSRQNILIGEFGITVTICASRILVLEILRKVLSLDCSHVYDFCGYGIGVIEFPIISGSKLIGQSPKSLAVDNTCRCQGLIRNGLFREVDAVQKIMLQDQLVVSGSFEELLEFAQTHRPSISRNAVIVGGGDVGEQLAQYLELFGAKVEIIDISRSRCEELSNSLPKSSVIHGNGSDIALIKEMRLCYRDFIIAVTGSDETNLMSVLVGKDLGAGFSLARLNRPGYHTIYEHLQVNETASPHNVMLKFMMSYLDMSSHLKAVTTEHSHCYFEFRLPDFSGPPLTLASLNLPEMAIQIGHVRAFSPLALDKNSPLQPGDSLIFASPSASIRKTTSAMKTALKKLDL